MSAKNEREVPFADGEGEDLVSLVETMREVRKRLRDEQDVCELEEGMDCASPRLAADALLLAENAITHYADSDLEGVEPDSEEEDFEGDSEEDLEEFDDD